MEMKKVRNNIFLDRQTICSYLQRKNDPHSLSIDQRGGHFYTCERTTQEQDNNNNSNNSCSDSSDISNISSSNTSSSEHRISSSSHTTTTTLSSSSSSCGSSLRSDLSLSSRPYKREINNNSNFIEKQCSNSNTHLNIIHNAKNSTKHLRIHSKMTSSNNNSGSGSDSNSVNDRSSSSSSGMDTNVDSPITDGNDSA